MITISPTIRISLGLTSIIISVLLAGNLIGLIPDKSIIELESRKSIAKTVTTQCTFAARNNNVALIKRVMKVMVNLNPDILSLGLRGANGTYIAQTRDHQIRWVAPTGDDSTFTHWQVPIHQGERPWATMEISFPPLDANVVLGYRLSPLTILLAFFAIISFILFSVYMKRALRDLDPTKVMPARVKYALDVLMEGVILLDMDERIVLANNAFAEKLGCTVESLMGSKASEFPWIAPETNEPPKEYPWTRAMSHGAQSNIPINLTTGPDTTQNFMVSSVPILSEKGKSRGIMVTFDDVTELEAKNSQLSEMLVVLKKSKDQVTQQNKKLEVLATRDSLTGCLNRRAFFEKAEQLFSTASATGGNLACVMADIDLFKNVNDTHGHSVGDQVIKFFAATLMSSVRMERGADVVGRYGGEEFCVILQGVDIEMAAKIIDRIRVKVMEQSPKSIEDAPGIRVTVSFGVSSLALGAAGLEELIAQADQALYKAKETGRNRVVCWEKEDASKMQPAA